MQEQKGSLAPEARQLPEELTARQIFNKIIKGDIVRIPNDPNLAAQLKNHLNVIKSREKKLFSSLGFDFISSVIQVVPQWTDEQVLAHPQAILITDIPISHYQISLIAPKKRRKYPAFVILNSEKSSVATSSE